MSQEEKRVLITGVTGFLGTHVCKQFLIAGYKVRGTVRSKNNKEKMDPFNKHFSTHIKIGQLELVEADLMKEDTLVKAAANCDYIVHVASPFTLKAPKHEDELIKPAV